MFDAEDRLARYDLEEVERIDRGLHESFRDRKGRLPPLNVDDRLRDPGWSENLAANSAPDLGHSRSLWGRRGNVSGSQVSTRTDPGMLWRMGSALVVIDMLNAYDFPDAEELASSAAEVVPNIGSLIARAQDEDVPVIYVNDNYGDWNSSADELLQAGLDGRHPELVEPLRPPDDVSFVIKARHTIFDGTPLEHLLKTEGIDRLVLTGQVTEQCVLYSALDAYVRDLEVAVPADAVAHIHEDLADAALRMMERNMSADVTPSADCVLR